MAARGALLCLAACASAAASWVRGLQAAAPQPARLLLGAATADDMTGAVYTYDGAHCLQRAAGPCAAAGERRGFRGVAVASGGIAYAASATNIFQIALPAAGAAQNGTK